MGTLLKIGKRLGEEKFVDDETGKLKIKIRKLFLCKIKFLLVISFF